MSEHIKSKLKTGELTMTEMTFKGPYIPINAPAALIMFDGMLAVVGGLNDKNTKANAEHLVKCWNCHDDLVAACEKYQRMIELLFELNPKVEIVLGSALGLKQAEETGKAALAKAKE